MSEAGGSDSVRIRSRVLDRYSNVRYAFGTSAAPMPDWFRDSLAKPRWKQTHSAFITEIASDAQDAGDTDGFVTRTRAPIGVVTADCLPVLAVNADATAIAAVHAGWRGLEGGILDAFARAATDEVFASSPEATTKGKPLAGWSAVIGPAIRACCYEVDEALIQKFSATFTELPRETITPTFRKLDLAAIARARLLALGAVEVEVLPYCTHCSIAPRFESFRRDHEKARQYSVIAVF